MMIDLMITPSNTGKVLYMQMPMDFQGCPFLMFIMRRQVQGELFYAAQLDTLLVSNSEIIHNTKSDPILSQILKMVSTGRFPAAKDTDEKLSPYMLRLHDLTIQRDCLMWGVKELHSTSRCGEDKVLGTQLCMVAQH